jgi:hypothetical protein
MKAIMDELGPRQDSEKEGEKLEESSARVQLMLSDAVNLHRLGGTGRLAAPYPIQGSS